MMMMIEEKGPFPEKQNKNQSFRILKNIFSQERIYFYSIFGTLMIYLNCSITFVLNYFQIFLFFSMNAFWRKMRDSFLVKKMMKNKILKMKIQIRTLQKNLLLLSFNPCARFHLVDKFFHSFFC